MEMNMKIEYVVDEYIYDAFNGNHGRFTDVLEAIEKHKSLVDAVERAFALAKNLNVPWTGNGLNYTLHVEYSN